MSHQQGGGKRVDPGVEERARELAQGMLRLASRVDLAERFLASAAHEMKTPLANLRGELQLALMREREVAEYKSAIAGALGHTEELIELTNDLLMYARVSYTPAPPQPEECNLHALVHDAAQFAQRRKGERQVVIEIDEGFDVPGRPDELTRLFRNLLDNAVEYSPPGVPVIVRADPLGERIVTRVEDGGRPLSPELASLIFEPFQRGPDAGGAGFGLGLGIARAIARGHGGDLMLDRQAPCVSFVVTLPLLSRSA
jgi:two-component system heavy metal sensor histidine kinase CusS